MSLVQTLISAKALISDPAVRITGTYARAQDELIVDPTEPTACQFCSVGAVLHILNVPRIERFDSCDFTAAVELLDQAARSKTDRRLNIVGLNDSGSHTLVMEAWDVAIELAKQRESSHG